MKKNLLFLLIVLSMLIFEGCKSGSEKKSPNATTDSLTAAAETLPVIQENIWARYNYDQREGKRLFEHYCSVCHGVTGSGDGFNSFNLDPKPQNLQDSVYLSNLSDFNLRQVISLGGQSMNKSTLMPAYSHTLTEIQIERLVKFIRTFVKG